MSKKTNKNLNEEKMFGKYAQLSEEDIRKGGGNHRGPGRGGGGGPMGGRLFGEKPKDTKKTLLRVLKYLGANKAYLFILIFIVFIPIRFGNCHTLKVLSCGFTLFYKRGLGQFNALTVQRTVKELIRRLEFEYSGIIQERRACRNARRPVIRFHRRFVNIPSALAVRIHRIVLRLRQFVFHRRGHLRNRRIFL